MIKIRVIAVGKDKEKWVTEALEHFEKILSRFASLEWKIIDIKHPSSLSPSDIKKNEATFILQHIGHGLTIALHDRGKKHDSIEFAHFLDQAQTKGGSRLTFVIGGAYGLDDTVLTKADESISLSSLTFSHQIVRLVLIEQLYRAYSILKGTDYHK